jgi:hypothetical protein
MNQKTTNSDDYVSADGLVRINKTTQVRRWPVHGYPVVVLRLKPQPGTRILPQPDGGVEWMPRFSEVVRLIFALGLKLVDVPADKPEERRAYWEKKNAQRHRRGNS